MQPLQTLMQDRVVRNGFLQANMPNAEVIVFAALTLKYTRSRFVLVFVGFRIQSGAVQLDSHLRQHVGDSTHRLRQNRMRILKGFGLLMQTLGEVVRR